MPVSKLDLSKEQFKNSIEPKRHQISKSKTSQKRSLDTKLPADGKYRLVTDKTFLSKIPQKNNHAKHMTIVDKKFYSQKVKIKF